MRGKIVSESEILKDQIREKDAKIEMQDKIIQDLVETLKRYAGFNERKIEGLPESRQNCEGYNWVFHEKTFIHVYQDKFGHVTCGGGPELAENKLREYNLLED